MTIQILPEDEKIIEEKLRTGLFRSVDELIHSCHAAPRDKSHPERFVRRPATTSFLA